ncbi:salivary peroxidase/catechol oxidase-like [Babylonia areolata]|uniref:salivary peroxidase/catechol oxidase-like n=1 Tax=Babylonia areolata TaxID=304850 RepID=UPI003FD67FF3
MWTFCCLVVLGLATRNGATAGSSPTQGREILHPGDSFPYRPSKPSHDENFEWIGGYQTRFRVTTTLSDGEGNVLSTQKQKNNVGNVYEATAGQNILPTGHTAKITSPGYYYVSNGYPYDDLAEGEGAAHGGQWLDGGTQNWRPSPVEQMVQINDRALLEEADADAAGLTHCLDVPRCSYVPIRKECQGHELHRTLDGTCNNLYHPMRGSAFQPFRRYLQPCYQDGVESPRSLSSHVDEQGRSPPLPSARLVSRTVHLVQDVPSQGSGLLMQFGQFVDHDITGTSSTVGDSGAIICCGKNRQEHKECLPITIPPGDTHYTDTSCINFVRSLPFTDPLNNTKAPREQRNEVTSFLDASVVYGSAEDQTARLRSFTHGKLKYSQGEMLPLESGGCVAPDGLCLLSGDTRANELPGLGALHVLFHRQHNRLAQGLLALLDPAREVRGQQHAARRGSPHAPLDEAVFRTARKILSAQLQHVVYTEWLPLVLGPFAVRHYGLDPKTPHKYDSGRDPTIANVFATAAFRFGHTLVPNWFLYGGEAVPLHKAFNNPSWVRQDFDKVLKGLMQASAQASDQFFVASLRNRLFEASPRRGLDLVALNVQRGRDHGLPTYQAWRAACGLSPVTAFNHSALGTAGPALREVYLTVEDIDLFTGAVSEPALTGGLVGPTLACLIGRQLADLKFADRFFYETTGPEGFTQDQLRYIYGTTMSGLICSNSHNVTSVQRNPFMEPSEQNPTVPCSQLKQTTPLEPWKQELNTLIHRLSQL